MPIYLIEERQEDIQAFNDKFGEGSFDRFNKLRDRLKNAGISVDIVYHTKNTSAEDMASILSDVENRVVKDEAITLTEGTKYDKKAAKILSDSGLFNEEESQNIINDLFRNDIEAFVHAPAWLEKYLVCIANIIVKEADGDKEKAWQFIGDCPDTFNEFLKWVKEYRPKLSDPDKSSFDKKFIEEASFKDIKDTVEKAHAERDAQSKAELADMAFEESNYTLVPIESYDEFHSKYGGRATGDGKSDLYAGAGGTAWCHANSKSTYDSSRWTGGGKRFFVLERKDWRDIPFNPTTNEEMRGKDDYGNSLIAILVSRTGNLLAATLRCNHVGVPKDADEQYKTYAELSKIAGFNVEDAVREYMDAHPAGYKIEGTPFYVDRGVLSRDMDEAPDNVGILVVPDGVERIGDYLCERAHKLLSVTLPDTVKEIGEDAFYACSALKRVDLNYGLEKICDGVFSRCESLKSIVIPDSVTDIGNCAFIRCNNLERAYLPANTAYVSSNCFSFCKNLKEVPIPFGVRVIHSYAFKSSGIRSIKFPSSLSEIHAGAFHDCVELTSVAIPGSVKEIGAQAFRYCEKLSSVRLGEGIRAIREYAFGGCQSLHTIRIPESVEKIEYLAFWDCPLDKIRIDGNPVIEGGFFGLGPSTTFYCKRGSTVEEYARSISAQVEYIDDGTAENEGITLTEEREEDIASFEDKFGKGSFERFNRLKGRMKNSGIPVDIVFHTKNTDPITMRQFLDDAENRVVKDVQTGEIKLNRKLVAENDHYTVWDVLDWETAMNMGDGTSWCITGRYDTNEVKPSQAKKYFNEYKNERGVKAFLFFMPKGNEEKYCMVIYQHLTYQFWNSSDSSTKMNEPPVSPSKSRVPIPEIDYMGVKVQYPEERAGLIFSGTRSVIGFTDDLDLDNAVIPEGVQAIAKDALRKSSIKKVTLPESLLEICAGAFQECDKLREIQVPSRCVFIGTFAFAGCSSIERVGLPESIRAIHSGAFYGCNSLKRIAIPSSVTTIEDNTFRACSELSEVILPEGLKSIEWGAFAHCPNLTKIRLHDLLVHIDHDAFYDHNPDLTIQCRRGTLGDEFANDHHLKVEYVD